MDRVVRENRRQVGQTEAFSPTNPVTVKVLVPPALSTDVQVVAAPVHRVAVRSAMSTLACLPAVSTPTACLGVKRAGRLGAPAVAAVQPREACATRLFGTSMFT